MALSCGIYVTSGPCGRPRRMSSETLILAGKTRCSGPKYRPKSDKMICKNAPDQSCRFIFDNPSITFDMFFRNASEPQELKNGTADHGRRVFAYSPSKITTFWGQVMSESWSGRGVKRETADNGRPQPPLGRPPAQSPAVPQPSPGRPQPPPAGCMAAGRPWPSPGRPEI